MTRLFETSQGSREVEIAAGKTLVTLPNGGTYSAGDVVTLTADEFAQIPLSYFPTYLVDRGEVRPVLAHRTRVPLARKVTDGVIGTGDETVTSATAKFTGADVGAPISDGEGKIPAGATIASLNSATSIEMSVQATGTKASGATLVIGRAATTAQARSMTPAGMNPIALVAADIGGHVVLPNGAVAEGGDSYDLTERQFAQIPDAAVGNASIVDTTVANHLYTVHVPINLKDIVDTDASHPGPKILPGWPLGLPPLSRVIDAGTQSTPLKSGGYLPALKGKVLAFDIVAVEPAVTAAKASTLTLLIFRQPRTVADAVTLGTDSDATLTSATAAFTAKDVGRAVTEIDTSGATITTHIPAGTTIASVTSGTEVELSANAATSGTGVKLRIGTVGGDLTAVAGGSISASTAGLNANGKIMAASAITADNTFDATTATPDYLMIKAASTTAFVEGRVIARLLILSTGK